MDTESFQYTFGPKAQRKRPNLKIPDLGSLVESAESKVETYKPETDRDLVNLEELESGVRDEAREPIFQKGQSRRIWNELYKVLDSSDVLIEVLDARDPMGTRCRRVEQYLKKEKPHKHVILLLNKVDLIPTWVTVSADVDFVWVPRNRSRAGRASWTPQIIDFLPRMDEPLGSPRVVVRTVRAFPNSIFFFSKNG